MEGGVVYLGVWEASGFRRAHLAGCLAGVAGSGGVEVRLDASNDRVHWREVAGGPVRPGDFAACLPEVIPERYIRPRVLVPVGEAPNRLWFRAMGSEDDEEQA